MVPPPSLLPHPVRLVSAFFCVQMFAGGGKKGKSADKEGASRFKKDVITYKNQALQPVRTQPRTHVKAPRTWERSICLHSCMVLGNRPYPDVAYGDKGSSRLSRELAKYFHE